MGRHACYLDFFIRAAVRFRTSVGDMSSRRGRGCSLAIGRKAVCRDLFAAEPAEDLTGRDVDALHSPPAYVGCLPDVKGERDTSLAPGQSGDAFEHTFPAGRFGLAVRCAKLHASE